jgi:nicotinamide-nucleotide amidase
MHRIIEVAAQNRQARSTAADYSHAVMVPTDGALGALAREVGSRLLDDGLTLVTCESCTGGWIAKLCTDIAGSSEWYDCGFVCYSNAAKTRDLGVPPKLIEAEGAVSEPVVRAMAEGALARTRAHVAIAVSGIAGPGGAVPGKPVGTVWFAIAQRVGTDVECQGHLILFEGNRDAVRRHAVEYALNLLRSLPRPLPRPA